MAAASICSAVSLPAHAADGDMVRVALSYSTVGECPRREAFEQRVSARSRRIRFDEVAAPTAIALDLEVTTVGTEFRGRLGLELRVGDAPRTREVTAVTCEEVVDGLALIVVVLLDPEAMLSPSPSPPPSPPPPPVPLEPLPRQTEPPRTQRSAKPRAALHGGLQGGIALRHGPAPASMVGGAVSAALRRTAPSHWSIAARVTGTRAARDGLERDGGTAGFVLHEVALLLAPLGVEVGGLAVHFGLHGSLGSLRAEGTETFEPRRAVRTYAEVGLGLGLDLTLGPLLEVGTHVVAAAPLRRDRYQFEPDIFHRVPWVTGSGMLLVGARFQ